jgi:mannosyltransferase OCH1-like enzyme
MIPRVFHSIWVGPPMPDHLQRYLATWTAVHPSWVHRLWGEADLQWLANQDLFDFAEACTRHPGQFRSDVARYEILHREGGVYVDCDFEARAPIDDLLMGVDAFAAWETDDVWVNNAILGCVPGHPLMADLIAGLPANVKANRGKRPNQQTGPQYLTRVIKDHPTVKVFPAQMFYPYNHADVGTERQDGPFPDAYAVHHWDNRRKKLGRPLPSGVLPSA